MQLPGAGPSSRGRFRLQRDAGDARPAKGKYLAIMNPDIIILDGWLSKLYQFAEQKKKQKITG